MSFSRFSFKVTSSSGSFIQMRSLTVAVAESAADGAAGNEIRRESAARVVLRDVAQLVVEHLVRRVRIHAELLGPGPHRAVDADDVLGDLARPFHGLAGGGLPGRLGRVRGVAQVLGLRRVRVVAPDLLGRSRGAAADAAKSRATPSPSPLIVSTGCVTTLIVPLPMSTAPAATPPAATAILSTFFNWAMAPISCTRTRRAPCSGPSRSRSSRRSCRC